MGITGFPSLGIPLNCIYPENLKHVLSVLLFFLRVCERNWPLWISPYQLLKSSFYLFPWKIQPLSSLKQLNKFILEYGSIPDQVTVYLPPYLHNPPNTGAYILYTVPSNLSDHLTTSMEYIATIGIWMVIVAPYVAKLSIYAYSCFSSLENKMWLGWLPIGDNHSSKSWSSCPWYWNYPSIRFGIFKYLPNRSYQHIPD